MCIKYGLLVNKNTWTSVKRLFAVHTAHDDVFPSVVLTVLPSYLQMWTSAAREMEGVTTSATTLWAVTAAPVTKATYW